MIPEQECNSSGLFVILHKISRQSYIESFRPYFLLDSFEPQHFIDFSISGMAWKGSNNVPLDIKSRFLFRQCALSRDSDEFWQDLYSSQFCLRNVTLEFCGAHGPVSFSRFRNCYWDGVEEKVGLQSDGGNFFMDLSKSFSLAWSGLKLLAECSVFRVPYILAMALAEPNALLSCYHVRNSNQVPSNIASNDLSKFLVRISRQQPNCDADILCCLAKRLWNIRRMKD